MTIKLMRVERWIELGVAGLVAVLMFWLVSFANSLPKSTGPHGEIFPTSTPDETNRVFHSQGFSIVAPENWDQLHFGESGVPAYLQIVARGTPGSRHKSMITITRLGENFDESKVANCVPTEFQSQPALECCRITEQNGTRSEYDLYFKRNQIWWNINFLVADEMKVLPNPIRQFLETFQG